MKTQVAGARLQYGASRPRGPYEDASRPPRTVRRGRREPARRFERRTSSGAALVHRRAEVAVRSALRYLDLTADHPSARAGSAWLPHLPADLTGDAEVDRVVCSRKERAGLKARRGARGEVVGEEIRARIGPGVVDLDGAVCSTVGRGQVQNARHRDQRRGATSGTDVLASARDLSGHGGPEPVAAGGNDLVDSVDLICVQTRDPGVRVHLERRGGVVVDREGGCGTSAGV